MRIFHRAPWLLTFMSVLLTAQVFGQTPTIQDIRVEESQEPKLSDGLDELVDELNLDLSESPISSEEQQVADLISQRVSSTEWLGAMAPVALSPFFGLTCLSGIAIIGEEHLPEDHYLRRASTPLRHPLVFLTFLVLTLITSIPKFSKVSKPFAQAVDQLETYAAIIILLVIRFVGSIDVGPDAQQVVYQAGVLEFTAESMLMIASIANIIVINTVKFFFEVLIWVTPVPFIDAIFEAANKLLCALLMVVYAFSPTVATIINFVMLAACLLIFRWVKRREVYYRTIMLDLLRGFWQPDAPPPSDGQIVVFPQSNFEGIKKLSRCELTLNEDGWKLVSPRLFRPAIEKVWSDQKPEITCGLLMNSIRIGETQFKFGRRYNRKMSALARNLRADYDGADCLESPTGNLAAELA